jgi:hypothetical protein
MIVKPGISGPADLEQAIEIFRLGLMLQMGEKAGIAYFEKYKTQIKSGLHRAKTHNNK